MSHKGLWPFDSYCRARERTKREIQSGRTTSRKGEGDWNLLIPENLGGELPGGGQPMRKLKTKTQRGHGGEGQVENVPMDRWGVGDAS